MSASVWKGGAVPKRGVVVGEQARWVGRAVVNKRGGEVGRTSRVMPLTKKPQAS